MNFRSIFRRRHQRLNLALVAFFCATVTGIAIGDDGSPNLKDVPYLDGTSPDAYAKKMCTLDVYLPPHEKNFPIMVWFHGGQLTAGDKADHAKLARTIADDGIAVVLPNYRLSPTVKYPVYLEDSALAVGWAKDHAVKLGADPKEFFIGGYSAGAYLAAMLAMDQSFLRKVGMETQSLSGVVCMSGMMVTPISVRAERGIGPFTIISDVAAPLYHTRKDTPPLYFFVGDEDKPARKEENEYFAALLKDAGDTKVQFDVFAERNHKTIAGMVFTDGDPVGPAIQGFLKEHSNTHLWVDSLLEHEDQEELHEVGR